MAENVGYGWRFWAIALGSGGLVWWNPKELVGAGEYGLLDILTG